jgi:hypothetical protein
MRLQRRVLWLTALAIVVGGGMAFAGIVNYLSAKEELQGEVFGSELPYPSVAAAMRKYWWGWVAIVLVWFSVVYLARRTTRAGSSRGETSSYTGPLSPMKTIIGAELAATVGTVTAFLVIGGLAGWF